MRACPVCGGCEFVRAVEIPSVPVFCNVQSESREEALSQPCGKIALEFCPDCTHLFNSAFDETLLSYTESYENSLHYSATFSKFADELASELVERYSLLGKRIVDIGCGKGDFLSLICELGANHGLGFDKSYEEGRASIPASGSVEYFKDFFSTEYSYLKPDLVSCRHVLEHIPAPRAFLSGVLSGLDHKTGFRVYFEVPNVLFTIRDMGIWDLIYEHCQYFSATSLNRIFTEAGVTIERLNESFGGQFLSLEGAVGLDAGEIVESTNDARDEVSSLVEHFEEKFQTIVHKWQDRLANMKGTAVVWGAGSKGATFLNIVNKSDCITGIVDINPNKQGKFVSGTGHEIISPDRLRDLKPEHVYAMNPMYADEIRLMLAELGVSAELHLVD